MEKADQTTEASSSAGQAQTGSIWPDVLPVCTDEQVDGGPSLKYVSNVLDHGEPQPYCNVNGEDMLLHFSATKTGGFTMRDDERIIPKAVKQIAGSVARKLVKGEIFDLSSTPSPAYLHHYVSQLGLMKNDQSCSKFLYEAAACSDPLQRMINVLKFCVATNWVNPTLLGCRAPLTPIIGETYQRELPDGTKFYAEQISHKPSISSFLLEGKDGAFRHYGSCEFKAALSGMNALSGSREGDCFLEFHDGVRYRMSCPLLRIQNLVAGSQYQYFSGHGLIEDTTNHICGDLHYNPWEEGGGVMKSFKKAFKWTFGKALGGSSKEEKKDENERPKRADDIVLNIYQRKATGVAEDQELVGAGEGSWLSHFRINGEIVWRITDDVPVWNNLSETLADGDCVLPSDMERRADIPPMLCKDWKKAEEEKVKMEELQRHDTKLRKAAVERREKKGKK